MGRKKLLPVLLSILLCFTVLPMPTQAVGNQTNYSNISSDEGTINSEFSKMSSEAYSKVSASDDTYASLFQFKRDLPKFDWGPGAPAPAKFTGVTYNLADNAVKVGSEVSKSIRSIDQVANGSSASSVNIGRIIGQGGLMKADALKTATGLSAIKPGTVFVDTENDLAFQVPTLPAKTDDQYNGYVPVIKPKLQEVIKDFKIPAQNVKLNTSNVTHFVNDTSGSSIDKYLKKPGQTYIMSQHTDQNTTMEPIKPTHLENIIAEFQFPGDGINLNGQTKSGGRIVVNVKGYLGIGDMALDGYYDKWDYAFYFSVAEEMQLQATMAAELNEEVRIPILGVDIGFDSDIGSIAGGLFIVVGVDGKFTLQVEARQWTKLNKVGLQGDNFFYVPTSIGPLLEFGPCGFDLDSSFNGAIDGYIKGGALLELSLLGFDIVGAGVFAGMGVASTVVGDYIETDLYGLVQAYVKFLGKTKYIVNWRPNILHKRQTNTAGYIVTFKEVCGYRDEVWGAIQYDAGVLGYVSVPDKDITLKVRNTLGDISSYDDITDGNGFFHFTGINLQKDDQVYINLQERYGSNYVNSAYVNPTFPFNKIILLEADFFNDYIKGYVPSVIVKDWANNTEKEMIFELNKSQNSSLTVRHSQYEQSVQVDNQGFFNLTGINVIPQDNVNGKLYFDGWVVDASPTIPSVDFQAQSIRILTSEDKNIENGKVVDTDSLVETIIITNMRGPKVYTGNAEFTVGGFTQAATPCYIINPETGLSILQAYELPDQSQTVEVYASQGAKEGTMGTSYFKNSVTTKWYWEPKPEATATPASSPTPVIPGRTIAPRETPTPTPVTPARTIAPTATPVIPTRTIAPTATPIIPVRTIAPTSTPIIKLPFTTLTPVSLSNIQLATTTLNLTSLNLNLIKPREIEPVKLLPNIPQHTFTLSYDDLLDKYTDYYFDVYSEYIDGAQTIKWDDKIIITYEGVEIVMEIKDERREGGDSKFENLSSAWTDKNAEALLENYMEKMSGSLVFPMPDEINRKEGISNIEALPAWSSQAAQKMINAGIMDLGSGGTFKSGTVTRSECAAYLAHAFGITPQMKSSTFSDIVKSNPYIPEINAAVSFGMISGYSTMAFGPGDPVTREQMAVMVMRGLKTKMGSRLSINASTRTFTDQKGFSSWASTAIGEISSLGIMNGYPDGTFAPGDNITFDEMAVMLNNLQKVLNK